LATLELNGSRYRARPKQESWRAHDRGSVDLGMPIGVPSSKSCCGVPALRLTQEFPREVAPAGLISGMGWLRKGRAVRGFAPLGDGAARFLTLGVARALSGSRLSARRQFAALTAFSRRTGRGLFSGFKIARALSLTAWSAIAGHVVGLLRPPRATWPDYARLRCSTFSAANVSGCL
jgi:hypothetical protein